MNYAQLSTKFIFTKLASAPSSTFQGTTSREALTILMRRNFHSPSIFRGVYITRVHRKGGDRRVVLALRTRTLVALIYTQFRPLEPSLEFKLV